MGNRTFCIILVLLFAFLSADVLRAAVIINHNCTQLSAIPVGWIDQARSNLRIGYSHTSHGSQLVAGLQTFRDNAGADYCYTSSDWGLEPGVFLNDYWGNAASNGASDLGHGGDLAWRDATIEMLGLSGNDRNVVMWSWCGGVSDNSTEGIDTYLNAMNELELTYPDITFIYMTGHLDGSGESGNLNVMNNRIRNYCQTHDKILFDFADIESYDPDGNYFLNRGATDNCDYDGGNWAQEWCAGHSGNIYCTDCDCQHSQPLNCNMKGAAVWWMLARIAGWPGDASPTPTPGPDPTATPGNLPAVEMDLVLEDTDLVPDDYFYLHMTISNWESQPETVDAYVVLDFWGSYWFWPTWQSLSQGIDFDRRTVNAGDSQFTVILEFNWPYDVGSADGLAFYGCIFLPGTYTIIGDFIYIPWSYAQ